ncbi:MAG: carboxypeptidase-like regulatory domain-containing protein [Edaphobacter sp.]
MKDLSVRIASFVTVLIVTLCLAVGTSWGQSGNQGSIVVTAEDSSGAVIPGASLELVELRSNSVRKAETSARGSYTFVNLNIGNYRLTISRTGYQTKIYDSVLVESSSTNTLTADLPVGAVTETVRVTGEATPVLQTSSTEIGTVINTTDIENLPVSGRSISSLTQLTAGYNGTWNGLPEGTQGTNIDGAIANNGRTKYQGTISTMVSPRIESFEQVSVVSDGLNLSNGFGTATTQLNYVSRRGSNRFHGRAYYDFRNSGLNANSWANNAAVNSAGVWSPVRKAKLIQHDFGVSVGGPILRDKLFFFGTYAEFKQPGTAVTNNFIFSNPAVQGNFTYTGTDKTVHTVNVFQLATAYNPANAGVINPKVNTLIQNAITAVNGQGLTSLTDPTILQASFNQPGSQTQYYPVARLDYNATDKVRMYLSWIMSQSSPVGSYPAPFPGASYANQNGNNFSRSFNANYGLDYIISPRLINQFKFGFLYNVQKFAAGSTPNWQTNPVVFFNMTGDGANKMSGQNYTLPSGYEYPVFSLSDGLTFQKGAHNFNFGFQGYREQDHYYNPPVGFPNINFGTASGDPIANAFTIPSSSNPTGGTLPYATSTNQGEAEQLYAVLTGRISSVAGSNGFDQGTGNYGPHSFNLDEVALATGIWFQDSWKLSPTLTFNYGLRWDFTVDPHDIKSAYHNALLPSIYGPTGPGDLFKPGTLNGNADPSFSLNPRPFHGWYKTPQPQVAINWNPKPKSDGFLKKILGDGNTVIRAGFGLRNFTEPYQFYWDAASAQALLYYQNFTLTANTTGAPGTYAPGSLAYGQPLPTYSFSPLTFPQSAPMANFTFVGSGKPVEGINANIREPYSESWTLGVQRALSRASVLEIRYNGNRSVHQWMVYNYNEVNIFENGFLKDFQNAQKNLASNGGKSFSDVGLIKTPIIDAAFANTASNFKATQFINYLNNGQAGTFANQLAGNNQNTPAYFCALVGASFAPCLNNAKFTGAGAGYPINFFQANPYAPGAGTNYMTDGGYSNYNALQIDLRQAPWHGLQGNANYTWSHTLGFATSNNDYLANSDNFYTLRDLHKSYFPQTFDIRQVTNIYGTYDLPFGKGRAFLNQSTLLNELIGGFNIGTVITYKTGAPFHLNGGYATFNQNDGGVTLTGVSASDLQNAVGIHHIPGHTTSLALDPKFFSGGAAGGTANYSMVGPNTTAGTIGDIIWLHGPHTFTQNMAISKIIPIKERYALSLQGEFINVWNHPTWGTPSGTLQSTSFGTSGISTGARQVELRGNFTF